MLQVVRVPWRRGFAPFFVQFVYIPVAIIWWQCDQMKGLHLKKEVKHDARITSLNSHTA